MSNSICSPRLTKRRIESRLSYNRVLVTLYWMADADGLCCLANNEEIGLAVGLGPKTVMGYLRDLELDGTISLLYRGKGGRRAIVLMDGPGADALLEGGRSDSRKRAL